MFAQQDPEQTKELKQAEELCSQAEAILQQGPTTLEAAFVALRHALELLGDGQELSSVRIRNRAGGIWLLLIEQISDLEEAQARLHEGIERLAYTPLLKVFEDRLALVEVALEIGGYFENESSDAWANWLESDKGEWARRLEKNLTLLAGTDSWQILQDRANNWREQLTGAILPAYLQPLYEIACQRARERNFEAAHQIADAACQRIPAAIVAELPTPIGKQGLWQLRDALQARLQAEKDLIAATKELKKPGKTLKQVFAEIDPYLSDHPDVPRDDLLSLLKDLKLAAEIESVLQRQSSVNRYAADICDYLELARGDLSIRNQLPEFLQRSDPQLAQGLQARMLALQENLARKPDEAILAMSKRIQMETQFIWPDSDPAPLLNLSWQLRWCLASKVTKDPEVVTTARAALIRAQQGPRLLLKQALGAFNSMRKHADLVYLQDILRALTKLNIGLSQLSVNGQPVITLPPVPKGRSLAAKSPELDEEALKNWAQILESWHKILLDDIAFTRTSTYEPVLVKKAGEKDQKFRKDLNELKTQVWPKLKLSPWVEGTSPARLEKELTLRLIQINAIQKAGSCLMYKQPMDCIGRLDDLTLLMEKTDPYRPSILDAQSQYLRISLNDMRRQARQKLSDQVTAILQEKTKPVERLHDEILSQPQSRETAEYVYHAVLASANQLSTAALQDGGRDKSNHFWEIIISATKPWTSPNGLAENNSELSPEVAAQWQQMNRAALKAYRKLPRINLKRVNGAIVAVILVVFVAWFGSNAWASRSREQDQLVVQAVKATTTQIVRATDTFQAVQAVQSLQEAATLTAEANLLATQQSSTAQAATAAVAQSTAAAETAQARTDAQATALHQTAAALAPTATALTQGLQKTIEAAQCKNPEQYALEILSQPILYPAPGTKYIIGNAPFGATATWEIKNTGDCEWTNLSIEPLQDSQPFPLTFYKDGVETEITPEKPVEIGGQVKVVMDLGVLESVNIDQEWILVANDLQLSDQPHLQIKVEDWVVPVTPRPTATQESSHPSPPKSTPKPPSRKSPTGTPPPR
jgi:hypothetical protein